MTLLRFVDQRDIIHLGMLMKNTCKAGKVETCTFTIMKNIILSLIAVLLASLSFAQKRINADSASFYIGQNVTICSKVYGVKAFDSVTLINVGAAYPKSPLTVAVSARNMANFKTDFNNYSGKEICVTGTIQDYKGKPEIVVTKESEINVVVSAP